MARRIWAAALLSTMHAATAQDIAPSNATVTSDGSNGTEVGILHGNALVSRYSISPLQNGTSIPVWTMLMGRAREPVMLTLASRMVASVET